MLRCPMLKISVHYMISKCVVIKVFARWKIRVVRLETMKVLEIFQELISFAISRKEMSNATRSKLHKYLYILKNCVLCIVFCCGCLSLTAHLVLEAETFQERAESAYNLLTFLFGSWIIMVFIWNRREIFAFIDHFGVVIDERKTNIPI